MARNLVVCLDGTSNEPESGTTNVARTFVVAAKDTEQLVYYDPGVGTMGDRGAVTPAGKRLTRAAGLVIGFGVKDNIAEAYTWLSRNFQFGDRIFVLGFSRGAYTARALTGMLRTVGLLRPGTENLVPYALKLYVKSGDDDQTDEERKAYWALRDSFGARFGNPEFRNRFDPQQVHFLGVWDTVKTIGWLNARARFEQARWPFTHNISNVGIARHAMALDERRRPYPVYRVVPKPGAKAKDHLEQWFAGVHSDVGGQYPDDHRLSDIAFHWMMQEARQAGLRILEDAYVDQVGIAPDDELPPTGATEGRVHSNGGWWRLLGWKPRVVLPADLVHPSVHARVAGSSYRPQAHGFPG